MSLKPQTVCPVPQETARIARAAYPKGNLYMQMRDVLGSIYTDEDFVDLFPKEGQPAEAPWRLALITVLQFLEHLSDRQAVDAVRGRIDWKYLLGLELTDAGFDASVLCEFRARLVEQHAEQLLLEKMLTVFQQKGWLKARGRQRTDSTHVLAKIRALNRVLCVWETMRFVLNSLAVVAPEWLRAHSQPEWVERYGPRSEDSRSPLGEAERQAFAEDIGRQGAQLLADLFDPATPEWLRQVPAVELLRQVWIQNYYRVDDVVRWRSSENIPPPSRYIGSPYDEEAHYSKKRSTTWVGFKVHLTESCEPHLPLLITHVETTSAPVSDDAMTAPIHAELERKALLPARHIVDTGYVDAKLLVESQRDYQIDLVGPTRKNYRWQASRASRFRCQSLSHRLGTATGYLSAGTQKPQLDSGQGPPQKRGDQDQVLDHRLPGLPISIALYAIKSPYAPHRHDSPTGTVSRLEAKARAGTDQGICPGLCSASRH